MGADLSPQIPDAIDELDQTTFIFKVSGVYTNAIQISDVLVGNKYSSW